MPDLDTNDAAGTASTRDANVLPPPAPAGYEEAAMQARLAAKLFDVAPVSVRIGRYEVVERIGAGGMGVVYSARDPELGRLVAIKVLSAQHDDDTRRRQRLIGEAQALARLSHPNVVTIYEVGVHAGATFLALELIQGETLATWQRREGRRWSDVLAAYVDAARGLAAAHEVGVVHRDVKPTNILIGADGRVRVVDFGLARAAAGDSQTTSLGAQPRPTDGASTTGAIAGTPAYMSPEQADGRPIDARSDIFSLCVSLFEALYGKRQFERSGQPTLPMREQLTPGRLKTLVPRSSPVPAWVLPILTAGLEPDVQRRTGDLRGFVAALERAPRRRRRRVLLAGLAFGLGLGAWGVRTLAVAPELCPAIVDTLPGAWEPARKQAIHAQFVASGLPYAEDAWRQVERSLDAAVIAWGRERRTSCLRTHIDRTQSAEQFDLAAACLADHERAIRDRLERLAAAGPAEVTQAHVLVRELADPAACTDTEVLRRGPTTPASPVREQVTALRSELEEVRILVALADYPAAAGRAETVVAAATIHGPLHAEAVYLQGLVAARRGAVEDADRWLTAAAAEAEENRDDHLAAAIAGEQTELATRLLRDPARARVYAAHYGSKLRRIAADGQRRAEYLDRLGEFELLTHNFAAALARHEEALQLRRDDDPTGRVRSLQGVANALAELGRVDESIERLQVARDLVARELGDAHPDTASADINLAYSLRERDPPDLDRAAALLRGALTVALRHGVDGVRIARIRTALAQVLGDRGEFDAALTELERGLPVLRARLAPTHDDVVDALALAVNLHIERSAWGPAADACVELIRIHRARGESIPLDLLINAGEFTQRQGDITAAIPYYDQALTILAAESAPDPMHLAAALCGRARAHLAQNAATRARDLLDRARPLLARLGPDDVWITAEVLWGSAQALVATGDDGEDARRFAAAAQSAFREHDPDSPELAAISAFLRKPVPRRK